MLTYPKIDPVFLKLGPFELRWYALAYIAGILLGVGSIRKTLIQQYGFTHDDIWDFLSYLVVGVLFGGRLGYILFYDLAYYAKHGSEVFAVWHGGMSFHGGALGCLFAIILFCKRTRKPVLGVLDQVALASPLALFLGRITNFINGELYGRVTTVSWGMVFPMGGPLPRHPSQLYEAGLEGFVLFIILWLFSRSKNKKEGQILAVFMGVYGVIRIGIECLRQPDSQLGFFYGFLTMGQMLSIIMVFSGILIFHSHPTAYKKWTLWLCRDPR